MVQTTFIALDGDSFVHLKWIPGPPAAFGAILLPPLLLSPRPTAVKICKSHPRVLIANGASESQFAGRRFFGVQTALPSTRAL